GPLVPCTTLFRSLHAGSRTELNPCPNVLRIDPMGNACWRIRENSLSSFTRHHANMAEKSSRSRYRPHMKRCECLDLACASDRRLEQFLQHQRSCRCAVPTLHTNQRVQIFARLRDPFFSLQCCHSTRQV